jgi:hypothetical protein
MSRETFNPNLHTPQALSEQFAGLPQNYTLVGSLGRTVLLGELIPLQRADGRARDIDVIDVTGSRREVRLDDRHAAPFPLDAYMTNTFRPIDDEQWGLFFFGNDEPHTVIDAEHCRSITVPLVWDRDVAVEILPVAIHAQIIDLKAPYQKNKEHIRKFRDFAADTPLPADVAKKFAQFKQANWEYEKAYHSGAHLSPLGRAWKRGSRVYHDLCPSPIQRTVETHFADGIRKFKRSIIG